MDTLEAKQRQCCNSTYPIQQSQENSNQRSAKFTPQKDLRERKKALDSREPTLNDRENGIINSEASLDNKLKKADGETQKYKQLYIQEQNSTSDLVTQLSFHKSEAKRWEGNYNNLYRQHVQLKRSKGLAIE